MGQLVVCYLSHMHKTLVAMYLMDQIHFSYFCSSPSDHFCYYFQFLPLVSEEKMFQASMREIGHAP